MGCMKLRFRLNESEGFILDTANDEVHHLCTYCDSCVVEARLSVVMLNEEGNRGDFDWEQV